MLSFLHLLDWPPPFLRCCFLFIWPPPRDPSIARLFILFWTAKFVVTPLGGFWPQKTLFGWKMAFCANIFETAHQILMIFSQVLDIIALNDLASVLCTENSSYPPWGGAFLPPKMSKIPPMIVVFLKVIRFCWKFALWVIWWCWIHFWCYFDPKKFCDSP